MFLLLPVGIDYRARRYPVVTFTIMGLNILVYIATLIYESKEGRYGTRWIMDTFWLIPETGKWYTYFTTMFVHGGFWHLFGNMIFLFLFGSCVEDVVGRGKFIIFYLLGGLAADFIYIAATPEHFASAIPVGGASGAISACIGGFVILMHKTKINFRYFIFFFFRVWSGDFWLTAWIVVSFWFLKDLAYMVLERALGGHGGGVAFGAHVGGSIAGIAMISAYRYFVRSAAPDAKMIPAKPIPLIVETPTLYLFESGNQLGPFTAIQINEMLALGSVSASAVYWEEGMPEWRPATEVRDRIPTGY